MRVHWIFYDAFNLLDFSSLVGPVVRTSGYNWWLHAVTEPEVITICQTRTVIRWGADGWAKNQLGERRLGDKGMQFALLLASTLNSPIVSYRIVNSTSSAVTHWMQSFNASVQHRSAWHTETHSLSRCRLLAMKQNLNYNVLVWADRANGRVICMRQCCVRLSSVTLCVVAKLCVRNLLLIAYRKLYMRNRLEPKWMTFTFV